MTAIGVATQYNKVSDSVLSLPGGSITAATTDSLAMSMRVHMQASKNTRTNFVEAYYYRDSTWSAFPNGVEFKQNPVTVSSAYRQPSTCSFMLIDNQGLLTRENLASSYNKNASLAYDPLLQVSRKICLRAGVLVRTNLSSGITPTVTGPTITGGTAVRLTDGLFGVVASGNTNYLRMTVASATPFTIVVDLGSSKEIRHVVVRFATQSGTCTLPASILFESSANGSTYTSLNQTARPAGGTNGDWENDPTGTGRNVEFSLLDVVAYGRYVRLTITPTGAQTLWMDEMAVYGGNSTGYVGGNIFTGLLGASVEVDNNGLIKILANDMLQKLARNYQPITSQFGGSSGPVELADILYTLATSGAYWNGTAGSKDAPFASTEIGWTSGSDYTGFKYPVWQGLTKNMLGHFQELLHSIGADVWCDGNGVLQLREQPYRQSLPDRVLIADDDGNSDVRFIQRQMDDTNLRNKVEVRSADANAGATSTVLIQPNSIAAYGTYYHEITDPILTDQAAREKAASYILRDYAWRVNSMACVLQPDFDTTIKSIYGFRASKRPKMYCKAITGSRMQELWVLDQMVTSITAAKWEAAGKLTPYVATGPNAPTALTATPHVGIPTRIDLVWTAPSDTDITGYGIYISSTGDDTGFPLTPSFTTTASPYAATGLTNGVQYWFFVTAIGANGQESAPSSVVTAVAGTSAGDDSLWTVTDLSVSFNQETPPADSNAYYTYTLFETWTSPPVGATAFQIANYGFKHAEFRLALGAIPSNPTDPNSWIYDDEWHGGRIPPGTDFNGNLGSMHWYLRFKSPTDLSGTTVYVRIFTWNTTNGKHGPSHASNIASVVIP